MACTLMKIACVMVACMVVFAPHANAITCGVSKAATADKKTASGCVECLFGGIKGIKPDLASGLPDKCGVSIPYKISRSTDCSKYVNFL
ncbi:non-specific lipid-transfer protein-like protein [Tanacetum coccineum]